jgi:DNA-binding NarL/FixJ family response regulator
MSQTQSHPKPFRIIIADDHSLIRQGLKSIIHNDPELLVVGEATNGRELLDLLAVMEVDLVVLDISMPKMSGLETIEPIRQQFPDTKVLILTMHRNAQYFFHTISAGAHGYLMKDDSDAELLGAISVIRQGKNYISPQLSSEVTDEMVGAFRERRDIISTVKLSSREKQVLQMVVKGLTSKQMAEHLCLSPRTIDHYRASLLKKYRMKNTVDLVKHVVRNNIVIME